MNMKAIENCEQSKMERLLNFKLPNKMKIVGWLIMAVSLGIILSTKLFDGDFEVLKHVLKRVVLLGLLIVVVSKEKVEDERIQVIRAKAFGSTFLVAVVYVLVQPIINYIVNLIVEPQDAVFEDLGDFVIVWFLLAVYLMVYTMLKRKG